MKKKWIVVCLIALSVCGLGCAKDLPKDWHQWSEKDARKVIRKACESSSIGFGEALGASTVAALGGIGKVPEVWVVWVTHPVRHALIRIRQIQERLTDEEANNELQQFNSSVGDTFVFAVSVTSMVLIPTQTIKMADDQVNTENPNRIFLQNPKDRDTFVRPAQIIETPADFVPAFNTLKIPSVDQDAFILFPKDGTFITDLKQEVELELVQEGKKRRVKFKPKDLVSSLDDL